MYTVADQVSTKKVRRFRVPPAALTEQAAAARRDRAARIMRIFAALAVLLLVGVSVLIAEPWNVLHAGHIP